VLSGHPHLEQQIVDSALGQFPVIGEQITAGSLTGSIPALVIGLVAALWAGMGGVLAVENALNRLWGVPFIERPGFVSGRLRALALLVVLGTGIIATTLLASVASAGTGLGPAWQAVSIDGVMGISRTNSSPP